MKLSKPSLSPSLCSRFRFINRHSAKQKLIKIRWMRWSKACFYGRSVTRIETLMYIICLQWHGKSKRDKKALARKKSQKLFNFIPRYDIIKTLSLFDTDSQQHEQFFVCVCLRNQQWWKNYLSIAQTKLFMCHCMRRESFYSVK